MSNQPAASEKAVTLFLSYARADEARRIFHLRLHMPDLRADAQPKYRHQQERKRDTDDHDEQPEAKKRRTERRSHICILMALPRNPTVCGSL